MTIIYGNLLDIEQGIVVHQVNCKYIMGAGLTAQICKKYPRHYADYMSRIPHLGGLVITQINSQLYVIGIYGQDGYGRDRQYTDYAALQRGLCAVQTFSENHDLPVYLPYGIGCGLAGGKWSVVEEIIEKCIPEAVAIKLKGDCL